MADRIRLFQSVQTYLQTVGIDRLQPNQHWLKFNFRNLSFLIGYAHLACTTFLFIVYRAETIIEYGTSFYACETEIAILMDFLCLMRQVENIHKLIEHCENFIEKSGSILNLSS